MVTVHIAKVLEMDRNTSPCPSETGTETIVSIFHIVSSTLHNIWKHAH